MAYTKVGGILPVIAAPPGAILSGGGQLPGAIPPSGPSLNPDAQAFLTASGTEGDETISNAINNLTNSLQAGTLWEKMYAIYPLVGGTSSSCKWNLKSPLDTNGAYRISFSGSISFALTGITPAQGSNDNHGDTFYPSDGLSSSSGHLSLFIRTYAASGPPRLQMGFRAGVENNVVVGYWPDADYFGGGVYDQFVSQASPLSPGYFLVSRTSSSDQALYYNGASVTTKNTGTPMPLAGGTIYIGDCANSPFGGCGDELSFATIGDGLTSAEAAELNTIVQTFQAELGR